MSPDGGPSFVLDTIARLSEEPRPANSEAGRKATAYMLSCLEETERFVVETSTFEFKKFVPEEYALQVEGRSLTCLPSLCSKNSNGGVDALLARNESDKDLSGKIVLAPIGRSHESLEVEHLAQRGAVAAILYQTAGPIMSTRVRYPESSIPCVSVSATQGKELWDETYKRDLTARIIIRSHRETGRAVNLYCGPKTTEPSTLFVAHRDSRIFSPGAIDNASGSAFLLHVSKISKDPSFAILSTDAEEYGLLGAQEFVRNHDLSREVRIVNLDSIGSGELHLVETSRAGRLSSTLNSRILNLANGLGFQLGRLETVRGSDSDIFMGRGFESSWIRSYPTITATTVDDVASYVQEPVVAQTCVLLNAMVSFL